MKHHQLKEEFDLDPLLETLVAHLESIDDWTYHDDNDDVHYIFEAVIRSFCKDSYYQWKNESHN